MFESENGGHPSQEFDGRVGFHDVLSRIPIPEGQKSLFKVLRQLPPDQYISKSELARRMGRPEDGLKGVLGALGRRINGTSSVSTNPGMGLMIDWVQRDGEWHYRLKEDFRRFLDDQNFDWLSN